MSDTYVYELDGNLYINLTNKCSNCCTFCVRNGKDSYFGNKLWLKKEPSASDVLNAIDFNKSYKEYVFCGFGEPTERIDVLMEVASSLKEKGLTTRLNTNGQGNLINKRDITKDLSKVIDKINVSLNASNEELYQKLCKSCFKDVLKEIIDFAKKSVENGIDAWLSIVDVVGEEEVKACQRLADKNGLRLRVRQFIDDN